MLINSFQERKVRASRVGVLKLRYLIMGDGWRRCLEAQTCASADPDLARKPIVISTFRRAAQPAAENQIRGPGPG